MRNGNLNAKFLHFPSLCVTVILIAGLLNSVAVRSNSPIGYNDNEKSDYITMDWKTILELDIETAGQIEFVIHKGSSTGTNIINKIPLSLVELLQSQPDKGAGVAGITATCIDYSTPFTTSTVHNGAKSIYVNNVTLTSPTFADKYVAGHSGTSALGDDTMPNGSYLTAGSYTSDYFYVIDFRLLPGLPAILRNAYNADAVNAEDLVTVNGPKGYAEPGIHSLYVQYVMVEDQ